MSEVSHAPLLKNIRKLNLVNITHCFIAPMIVSLAGLHLTDLY